MLHNRISTKDHNFEGGYEISLKRDLICHLIKSHGKVDISIMTELPFCGPRRRADVVAVNGHSHAFEIKTAKDNLYKLEEQLSDYKKVFDFVWAVVETPHLCSARENLPPGIGLMLYKDGEFLEIRRPRLNKRKSKYMLSYFIDNSVLRNMISSEIKKGAVVHEIRKSACKTLSIEVLSLAANAGIKQKYKRSSSEFFRYIGDDIALDDMLMLSARNIDTLLLPVDA